MIAGIAGFIISMSYFALFGKQIEYNAIFVSKAIIRAVRQKLRATAFPFGKAVWQDYLRSYRFGDADIREGRVQDLRCFQLRRTIDCASQHLEHIVV